MFKAGRGGVFVHTQCYSGAAPGSWSIVLLVVLMKPWSTGGDWNQGCPSARSTLTHYYFSVPGRDFLCSFLFVLFFYFIFCGVLIYPKSVRNEVTLKIEERLNFVQVILLLSVKSCLVFWKITSGNCNTAYGIWVPNRTYLIQSVFVAVTFMLSLPLDRSKDLTTLLCHLPSAMVMLQGNYILLYITCRTLDWFLWNSLCR